MAIRKKVNFTPCNYSQRVQSTEIECRELKLNLLSVKLQSSTKKMMESLEDINNILILSS